MDWTRIGAPLDVRALFPVERAALIDLLRGLDRADWHRPTVCPGWDVHDLVGHILNDYERRLSASRDGHALPKPQADEELADFLARVNEEFVVASRSVSAELMIDMLEHLGPQFDALWAAEDIAAIGEFDVSWVEPNVAAPLWLDIGREYTEFWVHQQQIRDATNRPGATGPELMHPVLDIFLRALPRTLGSSTAPWGATVLVSVPGPAGGRWTATRHRDGWRLAAGSPTAATATVTIDPDTLWRLASRGITPWEASRRVTITGDRPLASTALHMVSIIV